MARAALAALLLGLSAAPARAASVGLSPAGNDSAGVVALFTADPGEHNRVTVRLGDDAPEAPHLYGTVTFIDRGARIRAGEGCYVPSPHTAVCTRADGFSGGVRTVLGNGADTYDVERQGEDRGELLVRGGAGDDRLEAGDGAGRYDGGTLFGGRGDDTLIGSLASDLLDGGAGRDRLRGREGSDRLAPGAGEDRLDCGPRSDFEQDTVTEPDAGDVLPGTCEALEFSYPDGRQLRASAQPVVRDGTLSLFVSCPVVDDEGVEEPPACRGAVKLLHAGREIGRGTIDRPANDSTELALTQGGRALATRRRGVRATVRIRLEGRTLAWQTRLKLP